jgi:hypothetical protein
MKSTFLKLGCIKVECHKLMKRENFKFNLINSAFFMTGNFKVRIRLGREGTHKIKNY